MSETEFELEQAYDRADLAVLFEEFAAALGRDRTLRVHTAERRLAVDFPSRLVAELEVERDDDADPPVAELELELEWEDPDESSVRVEAVDDEAIGREGEPAAAEDPSEDPAAATMSPEGVVGRRRSGDESAGTTGGERASRFEVYRDRADEWRWRLVHWNGNIIADSGEGYTSRSNAKRAARSVMRAAPTATIEDRD
ncbi:amphi-Trp domain-containing protein [Halosolutus gelatinilyticus]|uniref:amphi-Trp domain-containing protein n=1 Tax=Halosolutus gelatinilyticus TaxID=2931975 RepID=UPI001FF38F98|nr:amphi-Trp domain-containing protein [Halosolutus gelatinilyticus]